MNELNNKDRLGLILTELVNKNRPTPLKEREVIGLGHVEQILDQRATEQVRLGRIDELEKFITDANSYGLPNGDFEIVMKQRIALLKDTTKGDV